ncbi:MAG: hypothetical protein CVU57_11280 [Deltaproteobacteria bacterium HGW-Deltaproteobacteria-15]|jgi:hypothetical protein|nr:MAG: hypothetical protein CVU57_11280 [Deltaproteobacteria bacterium HGW-Deltaproteobacteria-15]
MAFIVCRNKKSMPRVGIEMCEKCRKGISCEEYRRYKEPFLFREMEKPVVKERRRVVRKRIEPQVEVKDKEQEQLTLRIEPNSRAWPRNLR